MRSDIAQVGEVLGKVRGGGGGGGGVVGGIDWGRWGGGGGRIETRNLIEAGCFFYPAMDLLTAASAVY